VLFIVNYYTLFKLYRTCYLQEKSLKIKFQDEMAKSTISNEVSLSITEPKDELILKMKSEAAKAHTKTHEAKSAIPKCML